MVQTVPSGELLTTLGVMLKTGGLMIQPDVEGKLQPKTILVVEDDVNLRFVLADFLRDNGYSVVEAVSGDEALAFLSMPYNVDLVFTDVHMPGATDGALLARLVRDALPQVKVVITSGEMKKSNVPAGIPFIPKPYDLFKLKEFFGSLLSENTP